MFCWLHSNLKGRNSLGIPWLNTISFQERVHGKTIGMDSEGKWDSSQLCFSIKAQSVLCHSPLVNDEQLKKDKASEHTNNANSITSPRDEKGTRRTCHATHPVLTQNTYWRHILWAIAHNRHTQWSFQTTIEWKSKLITDRQLGKNVQPKQ